MLKERPFNPEIDKKERSSNARKLAGRHALGNNMVLLLTGSPGGVYFSERIKISVQVTRRKDMHLLEESKFREQKELKVQTLACRF